DVPGIGDAVAHDVPAADLLPCDALLAPAQPLADRGPVLQDEDDREDGDEEGDELQQNSVNAAGYAEPPRPGRDGIAIDEGIGEALHPDEEVAARLAAPEMEERGGLARQEDDAGNGDDDPRRHIGADQRRRDLPGREVRMRPGQDAVGDAGEGEDWKGVEGGAADHRDEAQDEVLAGTEGETAAHSKEHRPER